MRVYIQCHIAMYTISLLTPTRECTGPKHRVPHLIESQHHTPNQYLQQTVNLEMSHAVKHLQTDIGTLPLGRYGRGLRNIDS